MTLKNTYIIELLIEDNTKFLIQNFNLSGRADYNLGLDPETIKTLKMYEEVLLPQIVSDTLLRYTQMLKDAELEQY